MKLWSAALILMLAMALGAQDFRATLTGQVTDPSGAAIPGATVKATNLATNESKEGKTTAEGNYTIPYLNPGTYNVEIAANGFQTLKQKSIVLAVAQKLNLPILMTMGQMSQQVTVTGEQPVIDSADANRGLVFDPIKVQEYPLNGRQTYMLMSLTPGVLFTQELFGPGGFSGTRGWDTTNAYRINGARTGQNLFLLNGAPISNHGGTWEISPNVEAVQEFKVMTNTYDAGYGRFAGGVVNTNLKSGSNDWHGDVFDFFRNRVLDANSFQNNYSGQRKAFHNQHEFGGVAGGPIRRNKDFVFVSFEGWREVLPNTVVNSVPPALLRAGDFTSLGYKIFDPLSRHVCNAATEACLSQTYIETAFPGNVIPQSRISPIAQKILTYFPQPNVAGLSNNFINGAAVGTYAYNQPMARWDHVFNDNDKFYTLFTFQHGLVNRGQTGYPFPAEHGNMNNARDQRTVIMDWTHVVSPTVFLDVRGSYGRYTDSAPTYSDTSFTADQLGMTQMIHAPTNPLNSVPVISVGGYTTNGTSLFGEGNVVGWTTNNQWNFAPSLTFMRGKHTVHIGFEWNYTPIGSNNSGNANGTFSFDTGWTQQLSTKNQGQFDGSSVASLLLGYPASGSISYNSTNYWTRPYYAGYVQDDWKATSRLTLNLGFRYEVQVPWLERYNRGNRGFDPSIKNPLSDQIIANWNTVAATYNASHPTDKYGYPAAPTAIYGAWAFAGVNTPRRFYDTDWTNVAPRIGLAYRVMNKTVIRAGVGVFYVSPTAAGSSTGFSQATPYSASMDGITPSSGLSASGSYPTGPYSLTNPFPNGIAKPSGSSLGALTGVGNSVSFYPAHYKVPRTYQASFGIQQELGKNIVAEASYAGNLQIYTEVGYGMDNVSLAQDLQGIQDNSFLNRQLPNPFYGILGSTVSNGSAANTAASNLLRPYPLWSGITNNAIQAGHYRSDALQVRIEQKSFSGDSRAGILTWVLSYNFSKTFQNSSRYENWNTVEPLVHEIESQDKPQMVSFSGVWDLPVGKGRRFLNSGKPAVERLFSDWRVDWVLTYNSGYPIGWPNVLNYCNEWHAANQNEYSWINNNRSCYAAMPSYVLRTYSDRFPDIRNPSAPQLNVAVEKTLRINDRFKLMLRGEAFNLSNTAIRPGPDTSYTSANFGLLPKSQNNFPRLVQLSGKFYF